MFSHFTPNMRHSARQCAALSSRNQSPRGGLGGGPPLGPPTNLLKKMGDLGLLGLATRRNTAAGVDYR